MRFGFLLFARDIQMVGPTARLAEEQGFHAVGLGDGPAVGYDPFVSLTLAARATERLRLGTWVTNPQTRPLLLLANLTAAIDQLAPGGSFLGLGSGNAGVHGVGAHPANLTTLRDSVLLLRRLLAGEAVEVAGTSQQLRMPARPVPVLLAASGRRTLRLAGQLADMVSIAVGVDPTSLQESLQLVRDGATASGRDPAAVECWAYLDTAVAEERAAALVEVGSAAIARANILWRGPRLERVPAALRGAAEQLVARYDYSQHLAPGRTSNYRLAERLGLLDYILEQFALAGTPDDCRRQLERLRASGVDNVCFNVGAARDLPAMVRLLGQGVLPSLASA